MSGYKIYVYAISKNEEQFVDRWMDAVGEADLVLVTDTGSTDRTVEKLRARGTVVYEEHIEPWLFRATAECPGVREPWLELARFGYDQNDWPLTFFAVEKGLALQAKSNSYLMDPAAWGYALYDLGAISCYRLELYEKVLSYGIAACKQKPGDERLESNLELIREKCGGGGD